MPSNKTKKEKKQFRGQYDGEEVLMVFRKHPIMMRKGLIIACVGLLIVPLYVLGVSYAKPDLTPSPSAYLLLLFAGFVFSAILFFPSWMYWYFSIYIVTDQRLIQIIQKGFFHKKVVDIAINQIQMVNYEVSGIQETLLGFGTIMIQTFVGDLVINDVHKPAHIQHELLGLLRERGIAVNDSAPPIGNARAEKVEED
jgi:uncharacterized membrane protein YdbT with pleckstrin-like domain